LKHLELIAPFAGTVVDVMVKADELKGAGDPAILLADFSRM
jgi:hypothetical protein